MKTGMLALALAAVRRRIGGGRRRLRTRGLFRTQRDRRRGDPRGAFSCRARRRPLPCRPSRPRERSTSLSGCDRAWARSRRGPHAGQRDRVCRAAAPVSRAWVGRRGDAARVRRVPPRGRPMASRGAQDRRRRTVIRAPAHLRQATALAMLRVLAANFPLRVECP